MVERSERSPWYDGPTLLDHLHGIDLAGDRRLEKLRMPIQWVARNEDRGDARLHRPDRRRGCCARATRSWSSPPAR